MAKFRNSLIIFIFVFFSFLIVPQKVFAVDATCRYTNPGDARPWTCEGSASCNNGAWSETCTSERCGTDQAVLRCRSSNTPVIIWSCYAECGSSGDDGTGGPQTLEPIFIRAMFVNSSGGVRSYLDSNQIGYAQPRAGNSRPSTYSMWVSDITVPRLLNVSNFRQVNPQPTFTFDFPQNTKLEFNTKVFDSFYIDADTTLIYANDGSNAAAGIRHDYTTQSGNRPYPCLTAAGEYTATGRCKPGSTDLRCTFNNFCENGSIIDKRDDGSTAKWEHKDQNHTFNGGGAAILFEVKKSIVGRVVKIDENLSVTGVANRRVDLTWYNSSYVPVGFANMQTDSEGWYRFNEFWLSDSTYYQVTLNSNTLSGYRDATVVDALNTSRTTGYIDSTRNNQTGANTSLTSTAYRNQVTGANSDCTSKQGVMGRCWFGFRKAVEVGPSVTTNNPTIGAISATLRGNVTSAGTALSGAAATVTKRGFFYGTNQAVVNSTFYSTYSPSTGVVKLERYANTTGSYSLGTGTVLNPSTNYYFKAFVVNTNTTSQAKYGYGSVVSFTSLPQGTPPTVVTNAATNVSSTTATLNGTISANGTLNGGTPAAISSKRFLYGTSSTNLNLATPNLTSNFSRDVTGLAPNTTYYFAAEATNNGNRTGLGSTLSFTTSSAATAPTVVTNDPSNIGTTTVTLNGDVTSAGKLANGQTESSNNVTRKFFINGVWHNYGTNGTGSYTVNVTGLTQNTTYSYRAYASNSTGLSAWGDEKSFTTLSAATAPTVVTNNASNIETTTVTLNGDVTSAGKLANGQDESSNNVTRKFFINRVWHNYGTNGTGSYTVNVTGLTPNTTYSYRAFASNSTGLYAWGDKKSFTTLSAATAPTVVTNDPSNIGTTTVTLNGDVTSAGTLANGSAESATSVVRRFHMSGNWHNYGTNGTGSYTVNVTGLTQNTTYSYRAYASNSTGLSAWGDEKSFTTLSAATAPTVVTNDPSNIGTTTVTLNGDVTSAGTLANGSAESATSVVRRFHMSGNWHNYGTNGTGSYTVNVTELTPNTTYSYRAYASNSTGLSAWGDKKSFTTLSAATAPTVVTNDPSNIGTTSATLNGNVTGAGTLANGSAESNDNVTRKFFLGVTSYDSTNGTGSYTVNVTGLTPDTKYTYKAYAKNSTGLEQSGLDISFSTLANPVITTLSASEVKKDSAVLNATLTSNGSTIIEKGFYWGLSGALTNIVQVTHTADGNFLYSLNNSLSIGTTYYYKPYIKYENPSGQVTLFGNETSFTTLAMQCGTISPASPIFRDLGTSLSITITCSAIGSNGSSVVPNYAWSLDNSGNPGANFSYSGRTTTATALVVFSTAPSDTATATITVTHPEDATYVYADTALLNTFAYDNKWLRVFNGGIYFNNNFTSSSVPSSQIIIDNPSKLGSNPSTPLSGTIYDYFSISDSQEKFNSGGIVQATDAVYDIGGSISDSTLFQSGKIYKAMGASATSDLALTDYLDSINPYFSDSSIPDNNAVDATGDITQILTKTPGDVTVNSAVIKSLSGLKVAYILVNGDLKINADYFANAGVVIFIVKENVAISESVNNLKNIYIFAKGEIEIDGASANTLPISIYGGLYASGYDLKRDLKDITLYKDFPAVQVLFNPQLIINSAVSGEIPSKLGVSNLYWIIKD